MSEQQGPSAAGPAATPMHVLESNAPLSRSMIWRLQRTFYADQGIAAWSHRRVPQSVTTSPIIANAYARMVVGFLRDMHPVLDAHRPAYVQLYRNRAHASVSHEAT